MANFILGSDKGPDDLVEGSIKNDSDSFSVVDQASFEEDGLMAIRLRDPGPSIRSYHTDSQPSSLPSTPMPSKRNSRSAFEPTHSSRHYKKDSRFVMDLYTLTFDENETVDDLGMARRPQIPFNVPTSSAPFGLRQNSRDQNYMSMMMTATGSGMPEQSTLPSMDSGYPSGPMSLNVINSDWKPKQLPSLETNLHKILARKIQDSEEVSFKKAKLLTKAYYKLLRESTTPLIDPEMQVLQHREAAQNTKPIGSARISWQTLITMNLGDLRRTVRGLGNAVRALNEYLVDLLLERDDLLMNQDSLLEEISELTDALL